MFERLKQSLVESFVSAIALGWLFAQGILHFANIFAAPVTGWIVRNQYRGLTDGASVERGFSLQDAVPEAIRSLSLLLLAYFLTRWLYYKPVKKEVAEATSNAGQST